MKLTKVVKSDVEDITKSIKPESLKKFYNKTVLITGATGMVGSYILYVLDYLNQTESANIKIITVVRNPDKLDPEIKDRVTIYKHDVVEPFDLKEPVHYIIHAASPASPLIMKDYPLETNYANTLGTANVINLALKSGCEGLLFVSSREVYGEPTADSTEIFSEDGKLGYVDPLVPRNGYAEGKKAAENMPVSANVEYNLNTKIVRLAHTYGPGMSIYDGRVQADFLKNVMEGNDITLKSDGSSIRTYTYVADIIAAIFKVLLESKDIVYNIADEDNKVSIKELAEILMNSDEAKSKGLKLVFDIPKDAPAGTAAFKTGILSTVKIQNELGWKAKYSVKDGFNRTIKHLKEELAK
jgi:nucleoside-diphosphate-sugar epimerase